MWPYPWTLVGAPSHLGHMDRVAATMPSQAHAGAAQEAPDIGQWEGQDVPLVRPSSCNVKGCIPSSRRYLPTYLPRFCGPCPVDAVRAEEVVRVGTWTPSAIPPGEEFLVSIWSTVSRSDRFPRCQAPDRDECAEDREITQPLRVRGLSYICMHARRRGKEHNHFALDG